MNIPSKCPNCGAEPFVTFLRGQVARPDRAWYWPFKRRPPFAIICYDCKEVVGHEWNKIIDMMGMCHLSERDVAWAQSRLYKRKKKNE